MRTKASVFLGCLFLFSILVYLFQVQDDQGNVFLNAEFWQMATAADVESALKGGANINARDEEGVTPLCLAAVITQTPAVLDFYWPMEPI
ncbi:MAG: ankyrin repeat domain-containing protein [Parvularculales bacterium]